MLLKTIEKLVNPRKQSNLDKKMLLLIRNNHLTVRGKKEFSKNLNKYYAMPVIFSKKLHKEIYN